jgi:uncharacterized YigZ family protein
VTADSDARRVPAREGRGEVRERASRFFGLAARAASPAEAEDFLSRVKREHHAATHVAFAWKLGAGASRAVRTSDGGEPAGTAGRPVLGAIESAGLSDVVAVVVRYYGGTKLGTGGLARAYRLAADHALEAAGAETVYDTVRLEIRCPHNKTGLVRRLLDPPSVRLAAERFDPEPVLEIEVRRSRAGAVARALEDARLEFRKV